MLPITNRFDRARALVGVAAAVFAISAAGCAEEPRVRPPERPTAATPAARPAPMPAIAKGDAVVIAPELRAACGILESDGTPKFDFDSTALLNEGLAQLDRLASCLTSGPFEGREVALIGRTDPRGDDAYNLVLGEGRARAVATYLSRRGVADGALQSSSRGEAEATGFDEESWALDRRVDIVPATAVR